MPPPLVLVTEESDAPQDRWLVEHARVVHAPLGSPEADRVLPEIEGLLVRTYTQVTDAVLDSMPKLRVVGRGGVGLENIDVPACRRRGIEVVHTPEANTEAVAEFVFGVLLRLLRPTYNFGDEVSDPVAFKRYRQTIRGRQLDEMTMGVLGMGRIGRRVGAIASGGFGMRVLYNDLVDVSGLVSCPATSVDKATLYRESDVLTLHVDLRRGNEGLIGAGALAQMKPGALLVNTCRGEVVDAEALADALASGRLGGAALDVFAPEPPPRSLRLLSMEHVLLTPHIAARTVTAMDNMSWVVRDVVAVLEGRAPRFPAP